jgi:hypothetical protein
MIKSILRSTTFIQFSKILVAIICFYLPLCIRAQEKVYPANDNNLTNKNTLVIILGLDCPISQQYIHKLRSIHSQFSSQLYVKAIVPGNIKKSDLKSFVQTYKINFQVDIDYDYHGVIELGSQVTPEVFLYDSTGKLKYQGAIDNWYYELGRHRQAVTEDYLIDAIQSVLSSTEPRIKKTTAIGCLIQTPHQHQHH